MMKRHFLYIFLIYSNMIVAQVTFVPDFNLRKLLERNFTSFLDNNGNIIDAKASAYIGGFDCQSQKINDITGLSKFTGINSLACQFNFISNLDSILKLKNLTTLYAFNNKLTRLPDLSTLTKLNYLSCGINQLSSMPDLSKQVPLYYLDCSVNQIPELKGLDKLVNLQVLYVFDNKLDSLPDISAMTKLQQLMCHKNNLKIIKGLDRLTQLTVLLAGDNPMEILPDLGNLASMNKLLLWNCGLKNVPNISNMKNLSQLVLDGNRIAILPDFSPNSNLKVLKLHHNKIARISDISSTKNTLQVLNFSNNQLDSLPDCANFTSLDSVFIFNNRLTFEDVIPFISNTRTAYLDYSVQDSIGAKQQFLIKEQDSFKVVLGIDKKINNSQYKWYKNGKLYATKSTDTLLISKLAKSDSGTFYCVVTNSLAPKLTLFSRVIYLKVLPCIDFSRLSYVATDFDCNIGATLNIDESSVSGFNRPFTYKLVSNELGLTRFANEARFTNLFENTYNLEVIDKKGCRAVLEKTINLKGKKGADCKRLVINGEDNSINNTLVLEDKGTAKIFDSEGQLVHSINTPVAWDGRNRNGEFLPGYYVIDLNGKLLNVTLIK